MSPNQTQQTVAVSLVTLGALFRRRARRVGLGMKISSGPLAYKSRHAPKPLSALERAALIDAATVVTGGTPGCRSGPTGPTSTRTTRPASPAVRRRPPAPLFGRWLVRLDRLDLGRTLCELDRPEEAKYVIQWRTRRLPEQSTGAPRLLLNLKAQAEEEAENWAAEPMRDNATTILASV